MKSPEAVRAALATRYRRQERRWLRETLAPRTASVDDHGAVDEWPLRLSLGPPDERRALADPEGFRDWLGRWRTHAGPGTLEHATRRWRTLGRQTLPTHLVLDDVAALADTVGEGGRWRRLRHRGAELIGAAPDRLDAPGTLAATLDALDALVPTLVALDDGDWPRWREAADWLAAHPASGLYPRQLPIAGADTKTLERWRPSFERWLAGTAAPVTPVDPVDPVARIDPATPDASTAPLDALGLRRAPVRIRVRALDAALPGWPRGLTDVELPATELAALPLAPARVLIVENLQSGLALPPLPGTLAIVGLGYALEPLTEIGWLADVPIDYWGDIDTHGFAMLARMRRRFPQTRSRLMDEATLLAHRTLWVEESSPHAAATLDGLTGPEAALHDDLVRGRRGIGVRLEQERIAWRHVLAALGAGSAGSAEGP